VNRIRSSGQKSAWLWLAVLIVAVAAYGCGGGEQAEAPPDDAATEGEGPAIAAPPPTPPQPPAEESAEEAQPEEQPLPEDVSEWVKEHYYQAKKKRDPRLPEAVAYLGEHFAGTDGADSAAQLLTNLLEKSEEPEPEPSQQRGPRRGGTPGMGSAGMGPPEMGSAMGPEEGSGYEDDGAAAATEEEESYEDEYYGAEEEMPSGIGSGARAPGAMGRMQTQGPNSELVEAIVRALGVNGSDTAKQTLKQVVEGKFETDDNRTATLTTVETLVAHLCPEYEELLFRCLTAPETLRELGKQGQAGPTGRPEYGSGSAGPYGGMYPSMGGRSDTQPLTAEELQRHAFAMIGPVASEEFRVKLAQHLVKPDTVREDIDLFGGYLREMNPNNLAAQMVFYLDQGTDDATKQTVEENFLAYSSDALAGILGLPAEARAAAAERRSARGRRDRGPGVGGGSAGMYPAMGVEEEPVDMGSAEADAMGAEQDYGGPASTLPGSFGDSGRPSRYDAARDQSAGSRRPSRYDANQPGARGAEIGQPEFQPEDPDLPYRLARHLWGSDMVKPLENRLNGVGTLEGNARLVLLASTLPVDSTRATLYQMLKRSFQDGPSALESAGLLDYVVSDPGFLTVVKMLPRKSPEPGRPIGRTRTARGRTRSDRGSSSEEMGMEPSMPPDYEEEMSGPPGRMMPGARRPARAHPEAKGPEEAWMFTSEDLVRVLCERLLAAGRAGAGTALPPPEADQPPYGLPFVLRDDAMVVGQYHLDWPGDVGDKLSGVSLGGLRLHYVRAEQTAKLSTMESYYRRQLDRLGSPEIRPVQDGTWLDLVSPVPDTDWKRSIDVMCTATVPTGGEFDKKAEMPVTMDVLCIDIKDPAPAGEGG